MSRIRRMIDWFTLASVPKELLVAQHDELKPQIPLLYAFLSLNAIGVAYTHYGLAPFWMTVWVPSILGAATVLRLVAWFTRPFGTMSILAVRRHLRITMGLGALLSMIYLAWAFGLDAYGHTLQHAHIAIFIALTVMGCSFCLTRLPQSALCNIVIVTVPYVLHYAFSGNPVYVAITLNILFVTLVMVRVMLNSASSFEALVRTQSELTRLNHEMTGLAHTDALTGLPNRRQFFAKLDEELRRDEERQGEVVVGVIDLDRFKVANDTLGPKPNQPVEARRLS
ncbi:GGDEF domain-containing protein [Pararhizobium mangrovi]|uniref:diguanylate cyclase n=1 Tax=Pararhizobium mangrovi TaxID=2590452 RepID=A0A506TV99_9HYPH|nr:diguanylate cyclase [Pararhizobium mangrovi]TPW25993.1 diguanylate cyclase [Pararhizobium mangrovi]